jgi:hypothetical protein
MKTWVRITGTKTRDDIYGWIVKAKVQDFPDEKTEQREILLLHPPIEEKRRFDDLVARVFDLQKQRDSDASLVWGNRQSVNEDRASSGQLANIGASSGFLHRQVAARQEAFSNSAQAADARANYFFQQMGKASADLEEARSALYAIPGGASGEYEVQCFALRMAGTQKGLQVYDHGLILKKP